MQTRFCQEFLKKRMPFPNFFGDLVMFIFPFLSLLPYLKQLIYITFHCIKSKNGKISRENRNRRTRQADRAAGVTVRAETPPSLPALPRPPRGQISAPDPDANAGPKPPVSACFFPKIEKTCARLLTIYFIQYIIIRCFAKEVYLCSNGFLRVFDNTSETPFWPPCLYPWRSWWSASFPCSAPN